MEQKVDMRALNSQVDPAVFRRVWARVMADGHSSPIALTPEKPKQNANRPPVSAPTPKPTAEEEALRRLMDLAQEGIAADTLLARRGNQTKPLAPLANDHRRAMKKLAAAYFLMTGGHYQPDSPPPARSAAFPQMLREQFQWEQRWTQACRQAETTGDDPAFRELCRELAGDGMAHCRLIRGILERQ